jgi:hypothetical protein
MGFEPRVDEQQRRRQELAKELAADQPLTDAAPRGGLNKTSAIDMRPGVDGQEWADQVKQVLTDSISLGRELDRTNFYRDPKVGLALELVYEALKDKGAALPAFIAELLELSLRNAKDAPHYYDNARSVVYHRDVNQSLADSSWARENQAKAVQIRDLIKKINDEPVVGMLSFQQCKQGRAFARTAWETIEPRAAFWDKTAATAAAKVYGRADLQKSHGAASSFAVEEPRPIFAPIVKVDVARREVHGVMAEETPDKVKEIFDYASSKPHIQKWAEQFQRATDGKSVGNVRAMHSNISAGKLISIQFDDANKRIPIVAKVVDDNEWKKVLEGIYTGFSIGGKYLKRWADGENQRYTAQPSEVSLVDNPCMYGATFTAIKTDGSRELRKFAGGSDANGILRKTAETCEQIEREFNAKLAKIYR